MSTKFSGVAEFRWIVRDLRHGKTNQETVGVPAGGPKMYILQQKFIEITECETFLGRTFQWRDVPLVEISNEESNNG